MSDRRIKRIAVSVTNDLVTDNRVHKISTSLIKLGFDVTLVGRLLKNSENLSDRPYHTHRMGLWFTKGPLFYAEYNIRLFFFLRSNKFDLILANDLDSLLGAYTFSKFIKKPLIYDSHEYFTEVPELVNRPLIKKCWESIESKIVPQINHCYTVCQSIASIYNEKYGVNFKVVRNVPFKRQEKTNLEISTPPFPIDKPVILYQGAINYGRGIEEAILAMHHVSQARLVIIGTGDLFNKCKHLISTENLHEKVIMTGRIPFDKLKNITPFSTIGLSVEKDIGLNYRYALPNKVFDYIQSSVPLLTCQLPEIKSIVDQYQVGVSIKETTPKHIADGINMMLSTPEQLEQFKENCKKASQELTWENEEKIIEHIFSPFL